MFMYSKMLRSQVYNWLVLKNIYTHVINHQNQWMFLSPVKHFYSFFQQSPYAKVITVPIYITKKTNIRTSLVAQWIETHLPVRGRGFSPWSGKTPHAAEQVSACATTTEAVCCNYWSPCSAMKSSPLSPQLKEAWAQQWRPSTAKNKYINNILKLLKKKLYKRNWIAWFGIMDCMVYFIQYNILEIYPCCCIYQ